MTDQNHMRGATHLECTATETRVESEQLILALVMKANAVHETIRVSVFKDKGDAVCITRHSKKRIQMFFRFFTSL